MSRARKKVVKSLRKKGFIADNSDHKRFTYRTISGKISRIRTKVSHSKKTKEIPDNLICVMAKQLELSTAEFSDLVDCPMDQEEYEKRLRAKGLLQQD